MLRYHGFLSLRLPDAIIFIRKKQLRLYFSLIVQSMVILCSAAIYRCLLIIAQLILLALGKTPTSILNLTPNNLPIDGMAILTYMVLITLCWIVLSTKKYSTGYIVPLALSLTLLYGMIFVPWNFFGVTDVGRVIDIPTFLLKNFIHEAL